MSPEEFDKKTYSSPEKSKIASDFKKSVWL
jgi:hypothetical protein